MEESFEVRVKRLFGSGLFDKVPNSGFPATSWSVASGEVERQEWNRERGGEVGDDDREEMPTSEAFAEGGCFGRRIKKNGFGDRRRDKDDFEGDLDELEDEEEGGEEGGDGERDEREIRSGVGLDPTLDKEDEEDEFDRAAFGREDVGERVYMRDIKDRGRGLSYDAIISDLLEDSFQDVHFGKDPRADHFAASARLSEDKKAADNGPSPPSASLPPLPSCEDNELAGNLQSKIIEDANLKPILKRKRDQVDSKPKKHVRFDAECKHVHDEVLEERQCFPIVPQYVEASKVSEENSALLEESPAVPDYIRNPSKYTHYTFDSLDEVNDMSNRNAFEDFRNLVKKSNAEELQVEYAMEHPKFITFTPRKKSGDAMSVDSSSGVNHEDPCMDSAKKSVCSTGIAFGEEEHQSDASDMEEDHMDEDYTARKSTLSRKADRQYRSKLPSVDSA